MKKKNQVQRLRSLLILVITFALCCGLKAQTVVVADPGVISFDVTSLADVPVNANSLAQNSIYKLKLTIFNGSQANDIPNGTAYIRIGLGSRLVVDPAFVLAAAPYNNYFTWTSQLNSGQVEISGTLHTALPADFIGELSFNVKANITGTSSVSGNFLVSNNNPLFTLSDSNPGNNFTSLSYTVVLNSFSVSLDNKTDITCNGGNNGSITVSAVGGTGPYQYSKDGGVSWLPVGGTNTPYTFTGLTAGTYTITGKDFTGQTNALSPNVIVSQPSAIVISGSTTITNVNCVGDVNGAIQLAASGGTGSLQYSINGGTTYFSSGLFTNLAQGTYAVRIKDAANCTKDTSITLAPIVGHWLGIADNNWHNPINWDTGKVPDLFTHVVIIGGTPFTCLISSANAFASSVRVKANALLEVETGRTLTIQSNCSVLPPE